MKGENNSALSTKMRITLLYVRILFYARPTQLLSEHLNNVAKFSAEISRYKNISKLAGILHDIGKATYDFQNYLEEKGARGSVVHSVQGAFFIQDEPDISQNTYSTIVKDIISMVIVAHHGFLCDVLTPCGEALFKQKLSDEENKKYNYREAKQNISNIYSHLNFDVSKQLALATDELSSVISFINETYNSKDSAQFALGLFIKYAYSCLIDADRLDAYLSEAGEQYTSKEAEWNDLIAIFETKINKFQTKYEVDKIRSVISMQCKEASIKNTGIYQLSVPTGGGKTLSSMRFALHHCKEKGKKRIIYVIHYLSIIEQTASELRKILDLPEDTDILLEHHSGIVATEDESACELRKLAASRWDKQIIITTMVQFMESVMSSRASNLRKFHNMSDSVIIFDEIQSLPIKCIHLFNETISFLSKICNSTILLCTATQPLLSKTERKNLLIESNPELASIGGLFENIKRTTVVPKTEMDIGEFSDFIKMKSIENDNCLVIVNTKGVARDVFERLNDCDEFDMFHLSTSMCGVHRADVLGQIKDGLSNGKKIICVSTQLIEAGVDISFSCVIRAAAGLDSVAQAAGRCNRNGECDSPKNVYVVPLKNEKLDKLADIKCGKEITTRIIRDNKERNLLDSTIMEEYYKYYFYERKNLMDYRVDDGKTLANVNIK